MGRVFQSIYSTHGMAAIAIALRPSSHDKFDQAQRIAVPKTNAGRPEPPIKLMKHL
ncbi:hypothetical protein ONR75_07490 [Rhodopseudomonas sp. P2A-2r]|uniref:hypothetical protein n=1 Tax=Rhodopseudomonas sp. P2A-2r TaxID=2991972 RepID=UPI002234ACFE|nr:hypothetical protein [Rhodopseudomonas sp. P2A-2r]UZE50519.1 hypothetical protein ONR75_07490 [Rhodopseudomonas sp. P2A-2r]